MRIQWSDIAKAARETADAMDGKGWVNASIKARILLYDLADEIERLNAELAHERRQRDLRHQAYLEGCTQIEAMKAEHDTIANNLRKAMTEASAIQRAKDLKGSKPLEWNFDDV